LLVFFGLACGAFAEFFEEASGEAERPFCGFVPFGGWG
jgi:hypothetical protein